jgi:hypothetical protein
VHATLTIASTHHIPQATYAAEIPQAGTPTATTMLIMVVKPMGAVPKKSDCTGWWSISAHVAGYNVYRRIETMRMTEKRNVLRVKKTMLRVFNNPCWLGYSSESTYKRIATIPVPMVTAN